MDDNTIIGGLLQLGSKVATQTHSITGNVSQYGSHATHTSAGGGNSDVGGNLLVSGTTTLKTVGTDNTLTDALAINADGVIKKTNNAGGGGGPALSGDGGGLWSYTTNPTWNYPISQAGVLYNASGAGLTLFSNSDEQSFPYMGPMLAFSDEDVSPNAGGGISPATGMSEPKAGIYLNGNDLTIFAGSGIEGDLGGANTAVSVTETRLFVGHGGGKFGTSPGGYLDIGNTFYGDPYTCIIILPSEIDDSPSSGESYQVITAQGGTSTPKWQYISSSNWDSSSITFDDEVKNVSASPGDSIYDSIKDSIVESVSGNDKYVALSCVESPEIRYEDVISIKTNGRLKVIHKIDEEFQYVCEPESIKAISYTTSEPALCGLKIDKNKLIITFSGNIPEEVTVKLSGIRKGFKGVRFIPKTKEEMVHNSKFWNQAKL